MTDFVPFPKLSRLFRDCIVTEKLDGTNACVHVPEGGGPLLAGSRTRWITPGKTTDNYGFAKWVEQNTDELRKLGTGTHFGEWYGCGIQRGYDLPERRFALFNVARWSDVATRPACCGVVPVLFEGLFDTQEVATLLAEFRLVGSCAVPGYMNPEGVVVYHVAAQKSFKVTLDGDGHKGAK